MSAIKNALVIGGGIFRDGGGHPHATRRHIGQLPTLLPLGANLPGGAADLKRWLPLPLCKHRRTPCAH